MYYLDKDKVLEAMKKRGCSSVLAMAAQLGLHRNTIQNYLSGHTVFPNALEKLFQHLQLEPADVLRKRKKSISVPQEEIAEVVDNLHQRFPDVTFVLFGSRAKGTAKKYSDYDLGAYSSQGLSHRLFSKILLAKDDLEEDLPFMIDLVNLTRASPDFLRRLAAHWSFLSGRQTGWVELQKKVSCYAD